MTRRTTPSRAGAGAPAACVAAARDQTTRVFRRRDRSLAIGDRIALGIGVALAVLMLAAFTWRLARTVARDRAVGSGAAAAAAAPGH